MHEPFRYNTDASNDSRALQITRTCFRAARKHLHRIKNTASLYMNGKIHFTITREDEKLKVQTANE